MAHEPNRENTSRSTSSSKAARDRFDVAPARGRVGAHRITGKPRRFWAYFVSAVLGIALLTGAGVAAVMIQDVNLDALFAEEPAPEVRPTPQKPEVVPALDPSAPVVVLNGTAMPGFGTIIDEVITDNQWGAIIFSGDASSADIANTAVFYVSVADEANARGLAEQLGGVPVQLAREYSVYGARLVVVLGADYAGPGSEMFEVEPLEAAAE